MLPKKIPERKCLGCNQMKPKKELIRVLKTPEGAVVIDKTGRQNGRGAYICNSKDCYLAAKKTKGLERSLGIAIPEEVYESLLKEF